MASCAAARASSPATDESECIDMLHPMKSDNALPLTSTTPSMPPVIKTTDRPVLLYMAPVHKSQKENDADDDGDESVRDGVEKVQLH
ncbi:hypothetical protein KIN20_028949 [Parelaphostrongylus tenuis]|uniref:Uncharacterized protein n=1 Tax=Parelaphostrongylus tenuis TaxID=148309 RepID=A0AAD5R1R9_PARTN|nr:hypothetical protein KIN20_028949 [Parelaphostrongylus tenuis]